MNTRALILEKNFQSIRLHGFQGTRADKVVAEVGVTKGALYHYFPNKLQLGYAIVDEILAPSYTSAWKEVEAAENPIEVLVSFLEAVKKKQTAKEVALGCPLNNLIQEMSPLDDGFRTRLQEILETMRRSIEVGLIQGQKRGIVRKEVEPTESAVFILASFEGAFGIAKAMQSKKAFDTSINALKKYCRSLMV